MFLLVIQEGIIICYQHLITVIFREYKNMNCFCQTLASISHFFLRDKSAL